MAKIEQQFPIWDHNPLDSDALLVVRRSFHTLKGSGRMVNARAISDFAWAIENLLNRILEGTLQRSPAVLQTLRAAITALPQLVAELESGNPDRTELAPLAARAHALASGREDIAAAARPWLPRPRSGSSRRASTPEAVAPKPAVVAATPAAAPASAPPEAAAPEADNALREIYARETASHVSTGARMAGTRTAPGWTARAARRGLSRLPHAGRQLDHG